MREENSAVFAPLLRAVPAALLSHERKFAARPSEKFVPARAVPTIAGVDRSPMRRIVTRIQEQRAHGWIRDFARGVVPDAGADDDVALVHYEIPYGCG